MTELVKFRLIEARNGKKIAHATLNKPAALNALGIEMVDVLKPQLEAWQDDPQVACVLLDGEGDKAFCAGGDVVAMHDAMAAEPDRMPASLQRFFIEEYKLDYLIHTFSKPIVLWGNGIVMGGGLGLMAGASHRVVTETARIAMPEITIGLYPDVGGSWFLNKMPGGCGMFLGLTGASINAADALYIKLADHFIPHNQKDAFVEQLIEMNWGESQSLNREKMTDICRVFHNQHKAELSLGNVQAHQSVIDEVTSGKNVDEIVSAILAHDAGDDKWLSRAQKSLSVGSPITMHLVYQQLQRGAEMSLADCFRMELNMSCRCGEIGEFREGVRALLIDKDNNPKWNFAKLDYVEAEVIESFFTSRWPEGEHPLASLGK